LDNHCQFAPSGLRPTPDPPLSPCRINTKSKHQLSNPVHVPFMFLGFPCGCRRQSAGADSPGIGGGVFMATMGGGGASSGAHPGLGMCRRETNKGESGLGIANGRGTVEVEWKHHRCDRLKRPRVLSMDQCYLHVKTVFLGGGTQRSLLVRPSPFPSALIKRGDSWPPLPRVELIQKVSTKRSGLRPTQ